MIEHPEVGWNVWVIRTGTTKHEPKKIIITNTSKQENLAFNGVQCEGYQWWYSLYEIYPNECEAMLAILEDKEVEIESIHMNYKDELEKAYEDWADYLQLFKSKYGEV